jgi:SAM-dependent methyltransferase
VDPDAYRAASLDQWSRSAEGWKRRREELQRTVMPVSQWLIDAIAPQPGQIVLELAAGPGDTGFLAAELVQPGGRLISSDFAEPMVGVARERAAELGIDNVEFQVVNAESMKLDAASVDAVLCRWGYMLMADPDTALGETRRVLRPGGRVALAVWDEPGKNVWASTAAEVIRNHLGAPPPEPGTPGMFALAPEGNVQDRLQGAGFGDVHVEGLEFDFEYDDFDHWWGITMDLAAPLKALIANMSDDDVAAVKEKLAEALSGFAAADGSLSIPARALVATASA